MNSRTKRAIHYYYGFTIFFNLLIWVPIFYEFQKRAGLLDEEIFKIQSWYYLAFVLFELPTGYLADIMGKRKSLIFASCLLFLSHIIPLAAQSYWFLFLHFILVAGSRSLISGSASAYLYDYLDDIDKSDYKKYEGRARSLALIARLITWPLSGFLLEFHLLSAHAITAVFCLVAFFFSLKLPRDLRKVEVRERHFSLLGELRGILLELKESPSLVPFMIQGSGLFIIQRIAILQLFAPLLKSHQFSVKTFGVVLSLTTLCEAFASSKSYLLKKRFQSDRNIVFSLTLVLCFIFILLGIVPKWAVLPLFMVLGLICGAIFPIQKQLLNDHIANSQYRATVLSVESIVQRVLASLFTYYIAHMIGNGRLNGLFISTGIAIIFIISFVFLILLRMSQRNRKGKSNL